jgi:hypothetical protein
MKEEEVVLKTHQFLKSKGLGQQPLVRVYTDAHSTLLRYKELQPFQRFTLDLGDFVLHPDLVGQLGDGESIFAIEAKGSSDLIKGLAQAEMYQYGFHQAFLAAEASAWGTSLPNFARRKNIGVIAVSDTVEIVYSPEAKLPFRNAFQFITRQMESVIQVSGQQTFQFNIPTHYLVWCIALSSNTFYELTSLVSCLEEYPMPKDWRAALRGAQKLGIVSVLGDQVQLTSVGSAVKDVLSTSVADWAEVHRLVGAKGSGVPLIQVKPQAAAILRILLLQDPMVRLVIEGLRRFPNQMASFAELAIVCDQVDHARTPIFFLKPESAAALIDKKGRIVWAEVVGEDYRSRMFYQYKSILKHAGILKDVSLGGSTSKGYDPTQDIWELL